MDIKKLGQLYISFFKIGIMTFGGGYAMLPILQHEVVDVRGWATEEELLDMYAIGQCTPGIIAVNTATYVGYKQAGFIGGVAATLGEITPSIVIICLVASVLNSFIHLPVVGHALAGIRIVVCALMLNTVVSLARKGIVDVFGAVLFVAAFLLAVFSPIPTFVLILLAGLCGVIASRIKGALSGKKGGKA